MTLLVINCTAHDIIKPFAFQPLNQDDRIPSEFGIVSILVALAQGAILIAFPVKDVSQSNQEFQCLINTESSICFREGICESAIRRNCCT